jgi:hypothetical protein
MSDVPRQACCSCWHSTTLCQVLCSRQAAKSDCYVKCSGKQQQAYAQQIQLLNSTVLVSLLPFNPACCLRHGHSQNTVTVAVAEPPLPSVTV